MRLKKRGGVRFELTKGTISKEIPYGGSVGVHFINSNASVTPGAARPNAQPDEALPAAEEQKAANSTPLWTTAGAKLERASAYGCNYPARDGLS